MPPPDSLDAAILSITGALDRLEAALDRRTQADAARADLEQELAIMSEDRARLGSDLEAAEIANERLHGAATEIARRLTRMSGLCAALQGRADG